MEEIKQIKPPVEVRCEKELKALAACDTGRRPENWKLSPKAVRTFILGSREPVVYEGEEIQIKKKYLGNDALVERCIVTPVSYTHLFPLDLTKEILEEKGFAIDEDGFTVVSYTHLFKGYGVVMPDKAEISLDEPEVIKHGNKFGVKMKAEACLLYTSRCV